MSLFNKDEIISIAKELPEYEDLKADPSDAAAWENFSEALANEVRYSLYSSFESEIRPSIKKNIEADTAAQKDKTAFEEVLAAIEKYNNYAKENNINNRVKFYYENTEPDRSICDILDKIFERDKIFFESFK